MIHCDFRFLWLKVASRRRGRLTAGSPLSRRTPRSGTVRRRVTHTRSVLRRVLRSWTCRRCGSRRQSALSTHWGSQGMGLTSSVDGHAGWPKLLGDRGRPLLTR